MGTVRRRQRHRFEEIIAEHWALLNDAPLPEDHCPFQVLEFHRESRELWRIHGERITADWLEHSPGTRPSCWWRYSAPRAPDTERAKHRGCYFANDLIALRRKLSGTGCPVWHKLAIGPSHAFGIPDWYGDPSAPPTFETQFDYLQRLGLLAPDETAPDFEPHPNVPHIEDAAWWREWAA